jgi:hypothetical protein
MSKVFLKVRSIGEMKNMFSKQHYEKIAKLASNSAATTKEEFIKEMAEMFKADNSKFKPQKFFSKSGIKTVNVVCRDSSTKTIFYHFRKTHARYFYAYI